MLGTEEPTVWVIHVQESSSGPCHGLCSNKTHADSVYRPGGWGAVRPSPGTRCAPLSGLREAFKGDTACFRGVGRVLLFWPLLLVAYSSKACVTPTQCGRMTQGLWHRL